MQGPAATLRQSKSHAWTHERSLVLIGNRLTAQCDVFLNSHIFSSADKLLPIIARALLNTKPTFAQH